jgi:hypothetical protein
MMPTFWNDHGSLDWGLWSARVEDTAIGRFKFVLDSCLEGGQATALHLAVSHNLETVVRELLKRRANPNFTNRSQQMPLDLADRSSVPTMAQAWGSPAVGRGFAQGRFRVTNQGKSGVTGGRIWH